jgi:putative SOS response-associated peptidase YedK
MCGRYANQRAGVDWQAHFAEHDITMPPLADPEQRYLATLPATFSIAPGTDNPILRERLTGEGELVRSVEPARWGLRPAWAAPRGPAPINARLETVATNGMFRTALAKRRAVVPMTGYIEWTPVGRAKQPWFVHSGEPLWAAGLYEVGKDDAGGWQLSYAIVTTEARDAAGEVHDRMPVFLTPDLVAAWLRPSAFDEADRAELLATLADEEVRIAARMRTYPLDPRINDVRRIDPLDPTLLDRAAVPVDEPDLFSDGSGTR